MDSIFEQRVSERARHLWLRAGGVRGHIDHHWFQAVRDTLAEPGKVSTIAPVVTQKEKRSASQPSGGGRKPTQEPRPAKAVIAG